MQSALRYIATPDEFVCPPDGAQTWLRPVGITAKVRGHNQPLSGLYRLAGGWAGFFQLDVVMRNDTGFDVWRTDINSYLAASDDRQTAEAALHRLVCPRPDFAGLSMARPHIMGVVNVTPDSFSDGGRFFDTGRAIDGAMLMARAGASILDIGGESTRPNAEAVSHADEIARITPVLSGLAEQGVTLSADTRHTEVMSAGLAAGAHIINDVSGFTAIGATQLMAEQYKARPDASYAIAMHMQGEPQTMQNNPSYGFAPIDIYEVLASHIGRLRAAGLPLSHIAIDYGFGFGKTPQHNRQLIDWTAMFHGLGVPILVGVSRKSSIPRLVEASAMGMPEDRFGLDEADRLGGSIALGTEAVRQGAQFIRTHDVSQTYQALALTSG